MVSELRGMRPVLTQDGPAFGKIMAQVLSPSRPLQSPEFLRGRHAQLDEIKKALYQPGRHVLIHGLRGVGKSSLAQTAAFVLADTKRDPIVIGCDQRSTFGSVIREVFDAAQASDPQLEKRRTEAGIGFARFGLSLSGSEGFEYSKPSDPGSVNEAVRLVEFIADNWGPPVIVIDEFDLLKNSDEQIMFANFVKQISDRHIEARFIFCGIGESAEIIMQSHASVDRYFHTVELGRLSHEARWEIVSAAADRLGINADRDTTIRIGLISDGFPHYVHLIAEKLFWRVFEAKNEGNVTPNLFSLAMNDAAAAMDMKLKSPYEKATQKYTNDYEEILWAVADTHELRRRSTDIFISYERIMASLGKKPLKRDVFNRRMNSLKQKSHAEIISGTRTGWYEFSEKMIRGFVRLKALQRGVELASDHPRGARAADC